MCRSELLFFLILMSLPIIWSCAGLKTLAPTQDLEAISAPDESDESSVQAARLAKREMDAGAYQKALDIYADAHQRYPHDQALLQVYVQSIEKIKTIAEEAFAREDFVSAGWHYDVLLKNYPGFGASRAKFSFNINQLDEKLSISKKMISRQGFEAYRKGDLGQAIALWQALIDIDGNNPDILRALNTAKLQQTNLQK